MRCPKCHYIGFDSGDRCRNCGYEFSLAIERSSVPDLPIRTGDEPMGPLADLPLGRDEVPSATRDGSSRELALDRLTPGGAAGAIETDLPLLGNEVARPDVGPARRARPLRPPLSVCRSTPEVARVRASVTRARSVEPALRFEPPDPTPDRAVAPGDNASCAGDGHVAARRRRVTAAGIDLVLLVMIDAAVVYLTLELCGLTVADVTVLPVPPLFGFLALVDGGYLVLFTVACGQTIGKMTCGIRVVGADGERVRTGIAIVRAAASLVSVLPAGLGFLACLVDCERRAFHDRLAQTRVIKVP